MFDVSASYSNTTGLMYGDIYIGYPDQYLNDMAFNLASNYSVLVSKNANTSITSHPTPYYLYDTTSSNSSSNISNTTLTPINNMYSTW